jgi:hypothetical protein
MKKTLCYFLLLVFPASIFSQDKSLIIENFSLAKHSGNNNINFYILHTASPVNNLFQTEEKRHSDRYKIFQIGRFQQFSERPSLLESHVFKNKKQKWGYKYSPKYGQGQEIGSEEKSEYLAEGYLERLAERKKRSRKTWGAAGLIGGGLCIGLGASAMSSAADGYGWESFWEDLAGAMLIATGAGVLVTGAISLAIPSGAERELKDVRRISDPTQRGRACREALSSLASRGKKRRILYAGIFIAGFFAYILSNEETDSYLSAATFGACAVYELTRKTAAERAYQNYLKEIEHQRRIKKLN